MIIYHYDDDIIITHISHISDGALTPFRHTNAYTVKTDIICKQ